MFNLIIAYDLIRPGQNYDSVRRAIMQLGCWYQVQYSLFYVNTGFTPQQTYGHVRAAMDTNDRLLVVNAQGAVVSPEMPGHDIAAVNRVWANAGLPYYATGT